MVAARAGVARRPPGGLGCVTYHIGVVAREVMKVERLTAGGRGLVLAQRDRMPARCLPAGTAGTVHVTKRVRQFRAGRPGPHPRVRGGGFIEPALPAQQPGCVRLDDPVTGERRLRGAVVGPGGVTAPGAGRQRATGGPDPGERRSSRPAGDSASPAAPLRCPGTSPGRCMSRSALARRKHRSGQSG